MHRNVLRDHLNNLLDAVVPLNQRYQLWLEHDGTPPPYSVLAREEFQMQFGENWIGRRGPINWPARSPDLTPLDFFFCGVGTTKERVFRERPSTCENMMTYY
jgi:hypothetical protein